jgi:glycosyltransferase involved in cell wall biosynthesis
MGKEFQSTKTPQSDDVKDGTFRGQVMSQKLYFFAYPSAMQNIGGGEVLLLKTKEYLEQRGVAVHLFDAWNDRFKQGDFLHIFGSVKESLGLMEVAKSKGVTIVHSPIIWYNWQSSLLIPYPLQDRIMCILRQLVRTVCPFGPNARKSMMRLGNIVLGASHGEAEQIRKYFLVQPKLVDIVTYGANERYLESSPVLFENTHRMKNFILAAGRIEPRKNQLKLIRATNRMDRDLVIIGNPVSHHQNYYERCKREAGPRVHFIAGLEPDSEMLTSAFSACDVFVLPSWFETPGLAALEAGLSGTRVVITKGGPTREYFKNYVDYINPASEEDICDKIKAALARNKTNQLQQHIKQHYLWKHTADQTLKVYERLGFKHSTRNVMTQS